MGSIIFTVVLLLIAAGLFFAGRIVAKPTDKRGQASPGAGRWLKLASFALVAFAIIVTGMSVVTIVPTKQVGIPVAFGKPGDALGNGLHFKAPWVSIIEMDATVQPLDATGDKATIAKDADKSDVYVHNNVRWSIKEESASSLYVDYKEFDKIGDLLVQPNLRGAVADVMSTYKPLEADQPTNDELSKKIQASLQEKVGNRITIHSVNITLLDFSEATKNRINALNIERGNTAIAEQKAQTATKEAEANRILAESVSKDPNVLVSKCLDLIGEGKALPAGFQCWPGNVDGQSVIVNGAPKS
jgi:regulator of protease activity HflC (stomatin/prohibitin superfamily)